MIKTSLLLLLTARLCAAAPLTDGQILEIVQRRATDLEEVTKAPQRMPDATKRLCREPSAEEKAEAAANPHLEKFARLFVDKAGRPAAEGHEPVHPEGTVLLKEKLPAEADLPGVVPDLFTGMRKREKGYSPECGDWEFFTVSGDASQVTSRGKLASCMDCHQRYADTDFTSRKLVPARLMEPAADGSLLLHSRDAWVSGKMLRYEPQPHKDTLGYWVRQEDTAMWSLRAPAGRYEVEIIQGCGTGSGGASVELALARPGAAQPLVRLPFTVEETGGFQNWRTRMVGTFEIETDQVLELKVIPLTKPGGAVMDLRQIVLRPVAAKAGP